MHKDELDKLMDKIQHELNQHVDFGLYHKVKDKLRYIIADAVADSMVLSLPDFVNNNTKGSVKVTMMYHLLKD